MAIRCQPKIWNILEQRLHWREKENKEKKISKRSNASTKLNNNLLEHNVTNKIRRCLPLQRNTRFWRWLCMSGSIIESSTVYQFCGWICWRCKSTDLKKKNYPNNGNEWNHCTISEITNLLISRSHFENVWNMSVMYFKYQW